MKHKKIDMAHLHMHSSFSVLDSTSKIPDIVKRLKEYGHESALLTDHGTIAGVPEFYNECNKAKIKPILGCEYYFMPDTEKAKEEKNRKNHHLILMAMNQEGWTNIKKLTTLSSTQFYYSPRISYQNLKDNNAGLICLTACLKGIIPYNIAEEKYDEALEHAQNMKNIFGDRFYLEVQDGGLDIQIKVNEVMRRMAEKLDIKVVGCQDAHYVDRDDVEAHEGIWAIRTRNTFDDPVGYGPSDDVEGQKTRPYYSTREYWLKDAHHMLNEELTTEKGEKRKSTLLQSEIEMSAEIAARIGDVKIEKKMYLPKYEFVADISQGGCATSCTHNEHGDGKTVDLTSFNYLYDLVVQGYERVYKKSFLDAPEEHRKRIAAELADIKEAGLADYFLIVWDIVSWAKSEDIPVGPGRGSAAGSMVAYCLSITNIDPIKYGLLWERFYNAGRKGSMPDIDTDFAAKHRDKVIEYIKKRFGEDRVAQITTFNTLGAKAALKDTAKLLGKAGMSFEDANVMTRFVDETPGATIEGSLALSDKLKEYAEKNPRLFKLAKKIEGSPKSRGTHAAGILISPTPFSEGLVPLAFNSKEKRQMTEYDMETLDSLGLMKLDALGIKALDVLQEIEEEANK